MTTETRNRHHANRPSALTIADRNRAAILARREAERHILTIGYGWAGAWCALVLVAFLAWSY